MKNPEIIKEGSEMIGGIENISNYIHKAFEIIFTKVDKDPVVLSQQ